MRSNTWEWRLDWPTPVHLPSALPWHDVGQTSRHPTHHPLPGESVPTSVSAQASRPLCQSSPQGHHLHCQAAAHGNQVSGVKEIHMNIGVCVFLSLILYPFFPPRFLNHYYTWVFNFKHLSISTISNTLILCRIQHSIVCVSLLALSRLVHQKQQAYLDWPEIDINS